MGVEGVLDGLDVVVGEVAELDGVVALWNWVALVELAGDGSGEGHASWRHAIDADSWEEECQHACSRDTGSSTYCLD